MRPWTGAGIGVGAAVAAAALYALGIPFSKTLLTTVAPLWLASLLYLGGGTCALLAWGLRPRAGRRAEAALRLRDLPWLGAVILIGGVLGPVLLLWGLAHTAASVASLLLNLEGVFTALLAAALFREAVGGRVWAGVIAMTAGGILITWTPGSWAISWGALLIVGSCLAWGADNNLTRRLSSKDPFAVVGIKGLGAGACTALLAGLTHAPFPAAGSAAAALGVGAVSYGASLICFVYALRHIGAARSGALYGVAPFLGAALSVLLLREPVTLPLVGAAALMGAGAWAVLTEAHRHLHAHEPLVHEHGHGHDEHHQHAHDGAEGPEPHAHPHVHEVLTHDHPHTPDDHHTHAH